MSALLTADDAPSEMKPPTGSETPEGTDTNSSTSNSKSEASEKQAPESKEKAPESGRDPSGEKQETKASDSSKPPPAREASEPERAKGSAAEETQLSEPLEVETGGEEPSEADDVSGDESPDVDEEDDDSDEPAEGDGSGQSSEQDQSEQDEQREERRDEKHADDESKPREKEKAVAASPTPSEALQAQEQLADFALSEGYVPEIVGLDPDAAIEASTDGAIDSQPEQPIERGEVREAPVKPQPVERGESTAPPRQPIERGEVREAPVKSQPVERGEVREAPVKPQPVERGEGTAPPRQHNDSRFSAPRRPQPEQPVERGESTAPPRQPEQPVERGEGAAPPPRQHNDSRFSAPRRPQPEQPVERGESTAPPRQPVERGEVREVPVKPQPVERGEGAAIPPRQHNDSRFNAPRRPQPEQPVERGESTAPPRQHNDSRFSAPRRPQPEQPVQGSPARGVAPNLGKPRPVERGEVHEVPVKRGEGAAIPPRQQATSHMSRMSAPRDPNATAPPGRGGASPAAPSLGRSAPGQASDQTAEQQGGRRQDLAGSPPSGVRTASQPADQQSTGHMSRMSAPRDPNATAPPGRSGAPPAASSLGRPTSGQAADQTSEQQGGRRQDLAGSPPSGVRTASQPTDQQATSHMSRLSAPRDPNATAPPGRGGASPAAPSLGRSASDQTSGQQGGRRQDLAGSPPSGVRTASQPTDQQSTSHMSRLSAPRDPNATAPPGRSGASPAAPAVPGTQPAQPSPGAATPSSFSGLMSPPAAQASPSQNASFGVAPLRGPTLSGPRSSGPSSSGPVEGTPGAPTSPLGFTSPGARSTPPTGATPPSSQAGFTSPGGPGVSELQAPATTTPLGRPEYRPETRPGSRPEGLQQPLAARIPSRDSSTADPASAPHSQAPHGAPNSSLSDPRTALPGSLQAAPAAANAPHSHTPQGASSGTSSGSPGLPPLPPEASHTAFTAATSSAAQSPSGAEPPLSGPPAPELQRATAEQVTEQAIQPTSERTTERTTHQAAQHSVSSAEDQVQQPQHKREVWVRSRSASVQRILDRSTEKMSPEERTAYSVLSEMIPSTAALQSLRLSENGTTVRVEIRNPSRTEWADIARIKSEFRELTGRELMIYELPEKSAAAQRLRPGSPTSTDSFWSAPANADPTDVQPASRLRIKEAEDLTTGRLASTVGPTRTAAHAARSPLAQPSQTQTGALEPTAEAATAAALAGAPSYLPPDLIKYGRVTRVELSALGPADSSSSGSASRGRDALPPRRTQEERDDEQSKRQQQERAGLAARDGSLEDSIRERPIEALRVPLEDAHDRSDEDRGQRDSSGRCSTCGTELPEQQAQSCPVCAQSGPDVIAKTCVNYRFAGAKFLATVDAFSATEQAREMIAQGQLEPVASLRYQQKLVGHKDLLRFRGDSA